MLAAACIAHPDRRHSRGAPQKRCFFRRNRPLYFAGCSKKLRFEMSLAVQSRGSTNDIAKICSRGCELGCRSTNSSYRRRGCVRCHALASNQTAGSVVGHKHVRFLDLTLHGPELVLLTGERPKNLEYSSLLLETASHLPMPLISSRALSYAIPAASRTMITIERSVKPPGSVI